MPSFDVASSINQQFGEMQFRTKGCESLEITREIDAWLVKRAVVQGLLTLFIRHTSASLTIQENADPDVQRDLTAALDRLAPENAGYRHSSEGPDDMPAHIKAARTSVSLAIPVANGQMALGTWQGVFILEHRMRPHTRHIMLHYSGT